MTVGTVEVVVAETVATVGITAATGGIAGITVGIGIGGVTGTMIEISGPGIAIPGITGILEAAGIKIEIAGTGIEIQGITGIEDQEIGIEIGTLTAAAVPMETVVCIVVTHLQDNLVVIMAINYRGSLVLTKRDSP